VSSVIQNYNEECDINNIISILENVSKKSFFQIVAECRDSQIKRDIIMALIYVSPI
jgi:hypothetical protein